MKKNADGVYKDWGELAEYSVVRGRKGKNVKGGGKVRQAESVPMSVKAVRDKYERTVSKKSAEVMVKIVSKSPKDVKGIKASMDYIARNGDVELEGERGEVYLGKDALNDARDMWAHGRIGLPQENGNRKEALHVVLSMPAGTDREAVKNGAREFARQEFSNHQYVMAAHDDEDHPHVHVLVKMTGKDGIRLNPRKGDLRRWREVFAEKLRDEGIEATASMRRTRGIVQKPEKQVIRQIDEKYLSGRAPEPSKVTQEKIREAAHEARTGIKSKAVIVERLKEIRGIVRENYAELARELGKGNELDKRLALKTVEFVKAMPEVETAHDKRVKAILEAERARGLDKQREPQKSVGLDLARSGKAIEGKTKAKGVEDGDLTRQPQNQDQDLSH